MRKYRISNFETFETVSIKTAAELKRWINEYGVKDAKWDPVDLRKIGADKKAFRVTKYGNKLVRISK